MDTHLFRNIARRENPAVVSVTTTSRVQGRSAEEDFFRWLFGDQPVPRERLQQILGSGFLISQAGDILTNNHVVAGADTIQVSLFGDETKVYRATIVGRDPLTDSALIRLQGAPANLPTATLGDSSTIEPGDGAANRPAVHDAASATRELARAEAGQPVFVLIWRQDVELFLQMCRD